MTIQTKENLELRGWTVGSTQDFLGLSDIEVAEIERMAKEFSDRFYKARELSDDLLHTQMTI